MINTVKLSGSQMKLVNEIVAFYDAMDEKDEKKRERWAARIYTRKELRDAHGALRQRRASPYFISKNERAKLNQKEAAKHPRGCYTVTPFLKHAEAHPPAPEPSAESDAPTPTKKKAAAKSAGKKEAKATKKGATTGGAPAKSNRKGKKQQPAETEKTETPAAETAEQVL